MRIGTELVVRVSAATAQIGPCPARRAATSTSTMMERTLAPNREFLPFLDNAKRPRLSRAIAHSTRLHCW
jgi:hypothetical protein